RDLHLGSINLTESALDNAIIFMAGVNQQSVVDDVWRYPHAGEHRRGGGRVGARIGQGRRPGRQGVQVSTEVDARARSVRSGATGRTLRIPDDVVFEAILPELCNSRPALSTIGFLPTGMSCGGTIVLTRLGVAYEITVNWLTGGVEVGSRHAL